jgi:hypothetical protein
MRALDLIPIILSVPRNADYQRMSVEFRTVESSDSNNAVNNIIFLHEQP